MVGKPGEASKSELILFLASQYVDIPKYHALIIRKTFSDLNQSGGVMDRARTYWQKDPRVDFIERDKRFQFRHSGATISV